LFTIIHQSREILIRAIIVRTEIDLNPIKYKHIRGIMFRNITIRTILYIPLTKNRGVMIKGIIRKGR